MGVSQAWWQGVADLIWPPACPACLEPVPPGQDFCGPCLTTLQPMTGVAQCPRCADQSGLGLCGRCRAELPAFERVVTPLQFGGAVRDAVHRLKFSRAPWVARPLVHQTLVHGRPPKGLHVLVPVPLHARRHRQRGYNQAEQLARVWSQALQVPVARRVLIRTRETAPVAEMSPQERAAMVSGVFAVKDAHPVRGKVVGVVDDVVTTTSTVRAAARALMDAGAARVWVLAVARGGYLADG